MYSSMTRLIPTEFSPRREFCLRRRRGEVRRPSGVVGHGPTQLFSSKHAHAGRRPSLSRPADVDVAL